MEQNCLESGRVGGEQEERGGKKKKERKRERKRERENRIETLKSYRARNIRDKY